MRVVIQRVSKASVTINKKVKSEIDKGLLVLLGIEKEDTIEDIDWLTGKIIGLRVFPDNEGIMNLSINDIDGEIIVVSQFTLHASTKKGNRPSFIKAARPEIAIPYYTTFIEKLDQELNNSVKSGEFGADMKVELVNDGPVTLFIDSKNKS
jgi:D-tyrosyl-tRNA(Tyr) deacylase